MSGDHDCFTKRIPSAEHEFGGGIVGANSFTLSQQVSLFDFFGLTQIHSF